MFYFPAGYSVVESGDRVPLEQVSEDNILFMPNHQSTADVPLCMTLFTARSRFADRVMWIMDRIFKYSNFGCVSWMHDDFFILAVSIHNITNSCAEVLIVIFKTISFFFHIFREKKIEMPPWWL